MGWDGMGWDGWKADFLGSDADFIYEKEAGGLRRGALYRECVRMCVWEGCQGIVRGGIRGV